MICELIDQRLSNSCAPFRSKKLNKSVFCKVPVQADIIYMVQILVIYVCHKVETGFNEGENNAQNAALDMLYALYRELRSEISCLYTRRGIGYISSNVACVKCALLNVSDVRLVVL